MTGFGPSRAEARYSHAMQKAAEAAEADSPVRVREWLEAAEAAKRIVELQRLAGLGRAGEALRES